MSDYGFTYQNADITNRLRSGIEMEILQEPEPTIVIGRSCIDGDVHKHCIIIGNGLNSDHDYQIKIGSSVVEVSRTMTREEFEVVHQAFRGIHLDYAPGATIRVMRGPCGGLYLSGVEDLQEGDVFHREVRK